LPAPISAIFFRAMRPLPDW